MRENDGDDLRPLFGYAWSGSSTVAGYAVCIEFSNIALKRYDDESFNFSAGTNILEISPSVSDGEWYDFEVDWKSDGTHTLSVYEWDEQNGRGDVLDSGDVQDTTYDQGGISIGSRRNANATSEIHDRYVST
jgi:hypothetical protein